MTSAARIGRIRHAMRTLPLAAVLLGGCSSESDKALCRAPSTPVSEIQGQGAISPLLGQTTTAGGVVTAHFAGNDELDSGFFLQATDAQHDSNPLTSEALFVVADDRPALGHRAVVQGEVAEIGPDTGSLTSLRASAVASCGSAGEPVRPVSIGLPGTLEAHEAMLVRLDGELTITDVYNLGARGEMRVAGGGPVFQPTEIAPPGRQAAEIAETNSRRSLLVDDATAEAYPGQIAYLPHEISLKTLPRVGDRVSGLVGVLDDRGGYKLQATARMEPLSRRPHQRFSPTAGQVTVATLNLHNFFNGDGQGRGFPTPRGALNAAELERQRAKLVAAIVGLGLPDVMAFTELENDGYGPNSAIADLTGALNERIRAPGHTYAHVTAPVSPLGNDDVTVGLIYRQDKVRPVGRTATYLEAPFGTLSRPPLAQTFEMLRSRDRLTIVALHLKSKSCHDAAGPDLDQGDGQSCFNQARVRSVEVLLDWLSEFPTDDHDPDVLLIGDFNAYTHEDPIRALGAAGFSNLVARFHSNPQYTYIYQGAAGSLDHAFASPSLAGQAKGARIWHINADYSPWLNYRLEGKPAVNRRAGGLYKPDAVRSSDHDPLAVGF